MNRFISIDLELEQPNTRENTKDSAIDTSKIIQVGIVVFEISENGMIVLDKELINIHYPHPLSAFIQKLTGITSEEVNESTYNIHYALNKLVYFKEKYQTSRNLVQWGKGDDEAIEEECNIELNRVGFARSSINTKMLFQLYALMNNMKPASGLSKSMGKVKLNFECIKINNKNHGAHNALVDALNTAKLFNYLIFKLKDKQ